MSLIEANAAVMGWVRQGYPPHRGMNAARGIHLWDKSGKCYVDLCAGQINVNVGYGHPRVVDAIKAQADRFSYMPPVYETEIKEELAQRIVSLTSDDFGHVFFTNSGAEAIEAAIKVARAVTGRSKIYSAWKGYHGATAGASAISGDLRRLYVEPSMPSIGKFHYPSCYSCPLGLAHASCGMACLQSLRNQVILEGADTVAGILLEPILGASGLHVPPVEFIRGLRSLCDEFGIVLIFDETVTAWARTGKWFAYEHYGVTPDLISTAKGLTSGYVPMGALILKRWIYEFFRDRPFVSGSTTEGHALACAAALANLDIYEEEDLVAAAAETGTYLRLHLDALAARHPIVGDVRSRGLLACLEMNVSAFPKLRQAGADARALFGAEIAKRLFDLGVFAIVRGSILFVAPPLTIKTYELDDALDKVEAVVASLENDGEVAFSTSRSV